MDDLPLAAYTTGTEPDPRVAPPPIAIPSPIAPPIDEHAMAALPLADGEPVRTVVVPAVGSAGPLGRGLPPIPEWLAKPREHIRDPRLLLTGLIGVGVVLLVGSLLFGGSGLGGPATADASATAPTVFTPTVEPGNASVVVTGKVAATYELTGATGSGPAQAAHLDATWADTAGAQLGLAGPASAGTRQTAPDFVLSWTVLVSGAPVTFTSDDGECTVGMAVQPKTVTGSFVCKKVKSADGKLVVDAKGTYRT